MKSFGYAVAMVAAMSLVTVGCDKKAETDPAGEKQAEGGAEKKGGGDKAAEKKAEGGDLAGGKAAVKTAAGGEKKSAAGTEPAAGAKPAPGAAGAKPAAAAGGDVAGAKTAAAAATAAGAKPVAAAGGAAVAAKTGAAPAAAATDVEESYKGTIARAIVAAMNPDEPAGWELYQKELHTKEIFAQRLISIRRFNWPYMRRKVKLYLADDTKPEFKITRVQKLDPKRVKVFVHNEKSTPTPCILEKDPKQNGEYRITNCSL